MKYDSRFFHQNVGIWFLLEEIFNTVFNSVDGISYNRRLSRLCVGQCEQDGGTFKWWTINSLKMLTVDMIMTDIS